MKCPLFNRLVSFTPENYGFEVGDCLKEECAWWDPGSFSCSILLNTIYLESLVAVLEKIEEKMPPHIPAH